MKRSFFRRMLVLGLILSMASTCSLALATYVNSVFESLMQLKNITETYSVNTSAQTASGVSLTFRGFVETRGDKKVRGMESFLKSAPKGKIYLLPLLEIENKGNEPFVLNLELISTQVVSEVDGEDAYMDLAANIAGIVEGLNVFPQGEKVTVEPGEKVNGYLPYCVSKKWKKARICIFENEAGIGGHGPGFLFELTR